jgi:hypothetical protein
METNDTDPFWPDNTRLVISISMQMEAGAQPESEPFAVVPYNAPYERHCELRGTVLQHRRIRSRSET